jgi:sulfite reductase (ferredoxin)
MPEKADGRFSVRLRLAKGDIPAGDLAEAGRIASRFGQGLVRTTQAQDLIITGVQAENVEPSLTGLGSLGIDVLDASCPKIVTCTGAATCRLGLCLSRNLADAISGRFAGSGAVFNSESGTVRISGCRNSCGAHYVGHLGLEGKAKRVNGRPMPFYDVFLGACTGEGSASLGRKIAAVPARLVPELVGAAFAGGKLDAGLVVELASRLANVPEEPPEEYWRDLGKDEPFSLS